MDHGTRVNTKPHRAVAMEGYGGYARPLDGRVLMRGWRLYNVNNLKLARFKEIFPAPAMSPEYPELLTLSLYEARE